MYIVCLTLAVNCLGYRESTITEDKVKKMVKTYSPEVEEPPTQARPGRGRFRWWPWSWPRIGLGRDSDDDLLILRNTTAVPWMLYHGYHRLGPVAPAQVLTLHLSKHGTLSARPQGTADDVDYLALSLHQRITEIYIYRRTFNREHEVYDMRAMA